MKKMFLVCMALIVMTILGCGNESSRNPASTPYELSFYIDTIYDHLILTTVCSYPDNSCLSTSSLSLGRIDSIEKPNNIWKK